NPMSYNPPATKYYENSGCISFWFYPTSTPSSKKYLFYTKASSSNIKSYVAVYQNSSNELVLELKENSGTMNYISTNTKVQLNQWNFFGLNFRYRDDGQGYAKIFSYELYLNSEQKKANLSNKTIMTDGGLYHIGYRFDGANGYDALECKITALMIGCRIMLTTKQMKEIYSLTKDYMIGSSYLDGSSVDFSATTTHNLSETTVKQFEIYPLQNSVKSLSGKTPIAFDVRRVSDTDKDRSFNYNNKIKRYAYVADEGKLEYYLDTADVGTIMMRAYIREDANKQYILECKDVGGQCIGLYRGSDKYLYIEVNGGSTKTDLYFETDTWHTVGISFHDGIENSESVQNAPYVTVRAYLNGAVYSVDRDISSTFDMFYLSVGKLFDSVKVTDAYMGNYYTYYPMLGQVEMLATRAAFCEVATLNTLANELKDTTKVSEFDELGMLQKIVIHKGDSDILTNTMNYKKRSTYSSYISKYIDKEVIKYGSTTVNRSYGIDALGNVTSVTDTTFGSHTYTYNTRGFLTKEDSTEYAYDNNGNITKAGSTTFTYDTNIKDRLKSINGKEITYGSNPLNPASYNGNTYTFEGRRLTRYTYGGGYYSFEYNDQGLRTAKKDYRGVGSKYYYDGDKLITEVAPSYRFDFLYDENDQLYGFVYNNSDKYYYVRDFMQNILGIIDSSGNLVVKYAYTAYGTITSITGSLASTIGAYNPFRYKGYYYDTETSMYYCKSRYYVPEWCRWLNADSTSYLNYKNINEMNLFAYCVNNPISLLDPTGNLWILIAIIAGYSITKLSKKYIERAKNKPSEPILEGVEFDFNKNYFSIFDTMETAKYIKETLYKNNPRRSEKGIAAELFLHYIASFVPISKIKDRANPAYIGDYAKDGDDNAAFIETMLGNGIVWGETPFVQNDYSNLEGFNSIMNKFKKWIHWPWW
ncbi:MAG: hypothetical protein K2N64_03830, partial [Anaeroplasmataceae bacterium]|nr:hypothetical protein [Anaeroplasmataceae bacterium]